VTKLVDIQNYIEQGSWNETIPQTDSRTEMVSAGGDPVAYRIRGALIALRRKQSDLIGVMPLDADPQPETSQK